jgi:hypothetical protein
MVPMPALEASWRAAVSRLQSQIFDDAAEFLFQPEAQNLSFPSSETGRVFASLLSSRDEMLSPDSGQLSGEQPLVRRSTWWTQLSSEYLNDF